MARLDVGIKLVANLQFHVGVVYDAGVGPRMSHLAWHLIFRDDDYNGSYFCVPVSLANISCNIVAAFCRRVAVANAGGDVPYGFRYRPDMLDAGTGAIRGAHIGDGFTCATYVMAVFDRVGFPLLSTGTWPQRADDQEWQARLLDALSNVAAPEHLSRLREDIGCCRFRPEEVAASAALPIWPVEFTVAEAAGLALVTKLSS